MKITYIDSTNIEIFLKSDYLVILNDGKGWAENPRFDLFTENVSAALTTEIRDDELIKLLNKEAIANEVLACGVIVSGMNIFVWGNYTITVDGTIYDNRLHLFGVPSMAVSNGFGLDDQVAVKPFLVEMKRPSKILIALRGETVLEFIF